MNYKSEDSTFPFPAAYIDRCTGFVQEAPLAKVHVLCSKLVIGMTVDVEKGGLNKHKQLQLQVVKFRTLLVETFRGHSSSGPLTLKFYLLICVVEDLCVIGFLFFLDASPFE